MNPHASLEYKDLSPEFQDGVRKATFAYHIPHFRDHPEAHNFTSGSRWSKCAWCGRSRELVRHDDLPEGCQSRPEYADPSIEDIILGEEQKFHTLVAGAETAVPKLVSKLGMSGQTLAILHHTHGFDPETVASIVDVSPEMIRDYHASMGMERERSRAAFKPEVITAQ